MIENNEIKIWVRNSEGHGEDKTIKLSDILSLSKVHSKLWNRNNTFKKFQPKFRLNLTSGESFTAFYLPEFTELKKILTKQFGFSVNKSEEYEYKNYTHKKAIDWFLFK